MEELKRCIDEHHELYKRLYPEYIKPKWHHMLHMPEDVADLGLLLSCFVTERKHRSVKRAALWTLRHYDHTLIADVVYREMENMRSAACQQGVAHLAGQRPWDGSVEPSVFRVRRSAEG